MNKYLLHFYLETIHELTEEIILKIQDAMNKVLSDNNIKETGEITLWEAI